MSEPLVIVDNGADAARALADLCLHFAVTVQHYADPRQYLTSVHFSQRHVAVVDMNLTTFNGADLIQLIAEKSAAAIVFATGVRPHVNQVVAAMKAGAYDFLETPIAMTTLVDALNRVRLAPPILDGVCDLFIKALSGREIEVVAGLLTGSSSKQIGRKLGISHRTVEVHRAHIFKKLNVTSMADLIVQNRVHLLSPASTP